MILELSDLSANEIYHVMTQTVIPRPIAWVLTDSGEQNYNLAPFSYFTAVSSVPPLLMISVGKKPSGDSKDTVQNIKNCPQCVIHIASQNDAGLVTQTAATLPHGESEVVANKIELAAFDGYSLPRIKGCSVAFGCSLYEIKEIGDAPQTLVFAKIEKLYLANSVASEDSKGRLKIAAGSINPLARLGGGEYAGLTAPFALQRPN